MKPNSLLEAFRLVSIAALLLGGCTTVGNVVAVGGAAPGEPLPQMELLGRGFGGGPFRVTMPDGEVLSGRYMAPGGSSVGSGTAFVGGQVVSTTTTSFGSSGSFAAQAAGPHTSITCQGGWGGMSANLMLPGVSVVCETSRGARYQVMF